MRPDWARWGLATCTDNCGSSLALGHVLARMGAQVLLSPSAWAVDADHDNAVAPATPTTATHRTVRVWSVKDLLGK